MSTSRPQQILGIDALRFAAALFVVFYHLGFKAFATPGGLIPSWTNSAPSLPPGWQMSWLGWVGVQVFFVISGLVIARSVASCAGHPGAFFRARVLRLVPAVVIATAVACAIEITVFGMATGEALSRSLRTLTFWPQAPWIMGQFWTLGIEVAFYGVILVLVARVRTERLDVLAAWLIAASAVYWSLRVWGGGTDPLGRLSSLLLLQHGVYFGLGILLAQRQFQRWHLGLWALSMPSVLLQIQMTAQWEGNAAGLSANWPWAAAIFVGCLAFAGLTIACNDLLLRQIGPRGAGFLRQIGLMTFPLYLLHNHVGKPVMLGLTQLGIPPMASVLPAIGLCLFVAWWIAAKGEPVLRAVLARVFDRLTGARGVLRAAIQTQPNL